MTGDAETIRRVRTWLHERWTGPPERQQGQVLLWELLHILEGQPVPEPREGAAKTAHEDA